MPVDSRRSIQQAIRERKFLNKDFDSFRSDLEEYARNFFPDKIQDFSPNGFGGLLIELASYIGDVQSFYLDHQFGELNAETAVETKNLSSWDECLLVCQSCCSSPSSKVVYDLGK